MNIYSIYKIENLRTNKVYIGKTNRDGFTRIRQHLSKLKTRTHYNQKMQKDFDEKRNVVNQNPQLVQIQQLQQ